MENLRDLQSQVQKFCEERDWDQYHTPKELAIGLVTEASELLDLFRFQSGKQIAEMLENPSQREKIEDEMADVFFFLLRFSQKHQVSLAEALTRKIEKNAQKYPVEKAKGQNTKYNQL